MYTKFNQCLASFNSELIMKQCMTMQRLKNILLFYIMKKKTVFIWTSWKHKWMHVPLIIPVVLFKPKKNLLDANMHVN